MPQFQVTSSVAEIQEATESLGLPLMLKSRKGGYDGRGNSVLESSSESDIKSALSKLGCDGDATTSLDLYAEGWIDFDCEIAVMVVRSSNGKDTAAYPAVNAIQQDSICRVVLAPARNVSEGIRSECERLAKQAIDSLGTGASGMFGVELFVTKQGRVLLNEIAPRPHNTGHYTQDACAVSQFENHLRGVCAMPLGSTEMTVESAASKFCLRVSCSSEDKTVESQDELFLFHSGQCAGRGVWNNGRYFEKLNRGTGNTSGYGALVWKGGLPGRPKDGTHQRDSKLSRRTGQFSLRAFGD